MLLRRYNINNGYDIVRQATQNKIYTNLDDFKASILESLRNNEIINNRQTVSININNDIIEKINELNFDTY